MRKIFYFLILTILFACNNTSEEKKNITTNNTYLKDKPDTLFYFQKDTFALYQSSTKKEIKIKILKNTKVLFEKNLSINDFVGDTKFKSQAYFNKLFFTDFDGPSQQFIFTTYIKTENNKEYELEATFKFDSEGNFEVNRD